MRALVGGVGATQLRGARVSARVFDALSEGLKDPNPKVRWWCIQLLDHVPDERAIAVIAEALDDSVARVRRNAAHAMGCIACKPDWCGTLPVQVMAQLERLAATDPNPKVRAEARLAISHRSAG